jgi:hypothetical protein
MQSIKLLESLTAKGSLLSCEQRSKATEEAVRIYLAYGVGSGVGGAALTFLQRVGTAEAVLPIFKVLVASNHEVSVVKHELNVIEEILKREISALHISVLALLSRAGTIVAHRLEYPKQYEPDEIRDWQQITITVDCPTIRELAQVERRRRLATGGLRGTS